MTLGRLLLAWGSVAIWFLVVMSASRWWLRAPGEGAGGAGGARGGEGALRVLAGEAAVLTLLASLWFDSLGSGGWWLLFLLIGLLAAFPVRLQAVVSGALPRRPEILLALVDTVRYVGAGAILAWRLT